MNRSLALVSVIALTTVAGCTAAGETTEAKGETSSHFDDTDVEGLFQAAVNEASNGIDSADLALSPNGPVTASIRPGANNLSGGLHAQGINFGGRICDAYRAFENNTPSYLFVGAHMGFASFAEIGIGSEVVWDMWHEQLGVFIYGNTGFTADVNLGAQIYAGYAQGGDQKPDVANAWSGYTVGASASLALPFDFVSANAFQWTSVDGEVYGRGAGVGLGVGIWPFDVNGEITAADYFAWQKGVDVAAGLISRVGISAHSAGPYVQFDGANHTARATEMAKSLFLVPANYTDPAEAASAVGIRSALGSYMIARAILADNAPGFCN
jgi:hypothetical protein